MYNVPTPEVASRRAQGAAIVGNFYRQTTAFQAGGRVPDWMLFAHRLGDALSGLLTALDQATYSKPLPVTCKLSDGSGCLAPADLAIVRAALTDAAMYTVAVVERPADADEYRRIAHALGDGR